MNKKAIRKEINTLIDNMEDSILTDLSRRVSELVIEQPVWKEAKQILLFLSFGKEFKTDFLIRQALKDQKAVAVPRICGKEMTFHYIKGLDDALETNRWGIREPLAGSPLWNPEKGKTLMLTPGVAFGPEGSRLGRGGGFYDRFLSEKGDVLKTVGLSFEWQFRDDIPMEEQDRRLDGLSTESRFLIFKAD
ncbi:5-formyltetrahydrofolate cyclo-ligase [Spirochaeta isovalerica]|uniref:5-formyltetrahydrofolate cyclo-ligase n=1 Tax=Spirochaeta isovalerica TaxID=150 RepID=A0A841REK4_9SPIO|nr:5-formyltetrahydrofolate cyclo-ligase [Spirochaeta isovalerica]MBB6481048.1 5-formyltetrahydrofolate cyclo-ligase [Spirochaeta isovalerica]